MRFTLYTVAVRCLHLFVDFLRSLSLEIVGAFSTIYEENCCILFCLSSFVMFGQLETKFSLVLNVKKMFSGAANREY